MLNSPKQFYDKLSENYDQMINFSNRLEKEKGVWSNWLKDSGFKSVLDVGCGTGLHALVFSDLGMSVTGVDVSLSMLRRARDHARRYEREVAFVAGDVTKLPFTGLTVDLITCLGNTLPHLKDLQELTGFFSDCRRMMSPDSAVIIQMLNYNKIMNRQERIVSIKQTEEHTTVRFYDFEQPRLRFNLLTIYKDNQYHLESTMLTPFRADQVIDAAKSAGLTKAELFGNLKRDIWHEHESDNTVFLLRP